MTSILQQAAGRGGTPVVHRPGEKSGHHAQGARGPFPADARPGDTRLFARVGEPGYPEGIALDGARVVAGSVARQGPTGAVWVFDLGTAELLRTMPVEGPPERDGASNLVGLALDAAGRVYVADAAGARIVRLDPRADPATQEVYAEVPDLPPCASAPLGPCSPTVQDAPPFVNHPAFGPDGALYVSDSLQATVFRVPPGGGPAAVWFQDARFDAPGVARDGIEVSGFGLNGIALSPRDEFVYLVHSAVGPVAPAPTGGLLGAGGAVWRVRLTEAPQPEDLQLVHPYPGGLPDGLAFGASGRLYVALIDGGRTGHGISVLAPDGTEVAFFPTADQNAGLEVPYHEPANVAFHDAHRSILVTNQAFSDPERWAVLESFVDDTALPLHPPEVP